MCSPVAPLDGAHAEKIAHLCSDTMLGHGFEPMLSMTLLTERALTCVVSLCYDRDEPGEDHRAMRCYRDLVSRLTSAGYYSYRLGIQSMNELSANNGYAVLVSRLKQALDPDNILAPGRYEPVKHGFVNSDSTRERPYAAGK
jgi:4-cresol dehydrogenase (hydroxylating)